MVQQRHKHHAPSESRREALASSSRSDADDACSPEEQQDGSFAGMLHRESSCDYYDEERNDEDIISDENGEHNYTVQEVHDFIDHDGLAEENNDEVASVHINAQYDAGDC